METRQDKLFLRAQLIFGGMVNGLGEPILWHLALRRYGAAMLEIANRRMRSGSRKDLGRIQDPSSPIGLTYRAYRIGTPYAAQNMAMSRFNVGDLAGYRRWMHRAAKSGDLDAKRELRCFSIRQPHALARRLHRLRPQRRDNS
jgi:hypothetical protein